MSNLLWIIVVVLVLYFEWDLVLTALTPAIDICVALAFMVLLVVVIVVELALIVVAPAALLLGYESRAWHVNAARKLMFVGGKTNAESE